MKICAIIPTYNNAKTIRTVVENTLQHLPVIVVADGCTDSTLEILESLKSNENLTIISYKKNRGKGYALKQGFIKAKENGYTHALTIDADGQHSTDDIPTLIHAAEIRPEAIVIGNRTIREGYVPKKNSFANRFSNFWFTVQTGFPVPDTQSGFRVYPLAGLHGLHFMTNKYEAELTVLAFSSWANTPIISVPIRAFYPSKEDRVSHFRPSRDFTRISILNTFLCIIALIYGWPRSHWRFLIYGPEFLIFAIIADILCYSYLIHPTQERYQKLRRRISYGCKLLLSVFPCCKFSVQTSSKAKPIDKSKPCVMIGNHTSMLDIVAMIALNEKTVVIGQNWVINNIFFGRIARTIGVITVGEGVENYISTLESYVKDGYSIVIFPEATRSLNGILLRFHRGAFYVAEQLHLPIQPILFEGFAQALPKHPFHVGAAKEMKVTILPTIEPDDKRFGTDYRARAINVRKYYDSLLRHTDYTDSNS